MNENEKETWVANQRTQVVEYVTRNIENHGDIGNVPAFYIAPIISIWAIESKRSPGWVGFWVFRGNIPGDVIPRNWDDKADNPRKALMRMNEIWNGYVKHLRLGNNPPSVQFGSSNEQRIKMLGFKFKLQHPGPQRAPEPENCS